MRTQATATLSARPMLLLGSAGVLLLAVTAALWGWYGTTVFFEILRAGWMACF